MQTTSDGNCLYNSASVLIKGDQSANIVLRLLTAVELYLNPNYYADHPKLADGRSSGFSDATVFTLLLSRCSSSTGHCHLHREEIWHVIKYDGISHCP